MLFLHGQPRSYKGPYLVGSGLHRAGNAVPHLQAPPRQGRSQLSHTKMQRIILGKMHVWKATTECQTVGAPYRRRWSWPSALAGLRNVGLPPPTWPGSRPVELHGALIPTLLGHPGHPAQLWPDWFGRLIQSPRSLLPLLQGSCWGLQAFVLAPWTRMSLAFPATLSCPRHFRLAS